MKEIIGVYFDFFGTLIDGRYANCKIWSVIAKRLGLDIAPRDSRIMAGMRKQLEEVNRLKDNLGKNYMVFSQEERDYLDEIMLDTIGVRRKGAKQVIREEFNDNFFKYFRLNNGCRETLEQIKAKNIKIGLHTNGDREKVQSKLKDLKIFDFFEVFIHTQDYGYNKSDIEVYQVALDAMGTINPEEIIHVGDDIEMDIEMAKRIGMIPVLLDIYNDHFLEGIQIIHELPELLEFLEKFNAPTKTIYSKKQR